MKSSGIKNRTQVIVVLGLLSAIGAFSIDMYLPGFQSIANDLNTNVQHIQLSLTSYFIGVALGQLIYGPLLDRFGRKTPLLIGLGIYVLASIACTLSFNADQLILYRFVQALGSCSGMVASRAIVRDLFPPAETAKIFSMLMLVLGVSPILAPTVGGYVVSAFGWHGVFVALGLIGLVITLCVIFILPESKKPNKSLSLRPAPILSNYWTVFKTPEFLINAFAGGIAGSGMYAYLSGSSYVMMGLFGVNERQYGWIFAIIASALISASQANTLLIRRIPSVQVARMALLLQSLTGIALFSLSSLQLLPLYGMVALIFLFLACQGFAFPNTSAAALNPFHRLAGSASALMGSIQLGIGSIISASVSLLHDGTTKPMTGLMCFCAVSSAIILWSTRNKSFPQDNRDI